MIQLIQRTQQESVRELILWGLKELGIGEWGLGIEPEEALGNIERLLEELTGFRRSEIYLNGSQPLAHEIVRKFRGLVRQRKRRIPVDYLLGKTYFWNEVLKVNSDCLIPRPETESLIEHFVKSSGFGRNDPFSFLDLGSGSGAIGIALLREFPKAHAVFTDVSPDALALTRRNISRYDLDARAEITISNLFEAFGRRRWDAIVSNPPYLSDSDWTWVEPELSFEPRLALDGGADGFSFYRRISEEACEHLVHRGLVCLELGKGQSAGVASLLGENGFHSIQTFKDSIGIDRVIWGRSLLSSNG